MKKKIRVRCWVDIDEEKFFGPGPAELLEHIRETGSISQAAKVMDMSYKKAWRIVERLNQVGQRPYVSLHKGGNKGGGAELTEEAIQLLNAYHNLTRQLNAIIENDHQLLRLI